MAATSSGAGAQPAAPQPRHVHGDRGVFYGGGWVDIEDLHRAWSPASQPFSGDHRVPTPAAATTPGFDYDVAIVGAGCIGAAVARELSRYLLRVVLIDKSDDVTCGATKGNSGIVHAGYDDVPGSERAKYCWKGNQMFPQLDRELRFGLQRNGSLVVARGAEDEATLRDLVERGKQNGVKNLRIFDRAELRRMEPLINPEATAALFAPDAATLTPYEYTIALAENAVDNGVELRLNRAVEALEPIPGGGFTLSAVNASPRRASGLVQRLLPLLAVAPLLVGCAVAALRPAELAQQLLFLLPGLGMAPAALATQLSSSAIALATITLSGVAAAVFSPPSSEAGARETLRARFVVNAAGLGSDKIAKLVGDDSFYIKPRIGEYLLMHKKEGFRANHVLFPAPGKMGKGVLVQTTLWGNLILGPTASDLADPTTATRSVADIMQYILARCRDLVPSFDAGEVIHSFAGLRAKSSTGDWAIRRSTVAPDLVHAAGIDSPGLAGSPAIAAEVVSILKRAGLAAAPNPAFNPHRKPIIVVKDQSPKTFPYVAFPVPADGSAAVATPIKVDGEGPACNVVCRCERVTEAEIVEACHRSLPCESTQAVRKRTRAGMGYCQGEFCEARVKAILAREHGLDAAHVQGRPWPATSILPKRWVDDADRAMMRALVS